MSIEKAQFVSWFRSASPYIHVHRGKTFVIQVNDKVIHSDEFTGLVHDLALLTNLGIKLALVFGTRDSIESYLDEKQANSEYHNDIRITDADTMEFAKEVAGRLLMDIQAGLSMGLGNTPMSNAEIRVNTGNYVSAKPMGIIDGVNYEFTGKTRHIDVDAMLDKLANGEIIVLPPVGYSITGEAYNLPAVAMAADVAIALQADKLIYFMEKDQQAVFMGEKQANQLNQAEAQGLLTRVDGRSDSYFCLKNAIEACDNGVERVHMLNQEQDGAILNELFSRDGSGLMITTSAYDVVRKATSDDIGGILDLIKPLEQQGILVKRSREKLELEANCFTILIRDGVIIGCVGLYPHPDDKVAEVACLAVHPDYHNDGCGNQLLDEIENEARRLDINQLFVLTTQTEHWFLERGFNEASPGNLPIEKQALYNYHRNAKVLIKKFEV